MATAKITYNILEAILRELHFSVAITEEFRVYRHDATQAMILLPNKNIDNRLVSEFHFSSVCSTLLAQGVIENLQTLDKVFNRLKRAKKLPVQPPVAPAA